MCRIVDNLFQGRDQDTFSSMVLETVYHWEPQLIFFELCYESPIEKQHENSHLIRSFHHQVIFHLPKVISSITQYDWNCPQCYFLCYVCYVMWNLFTVGSIQFCDDSTTAQWLPNLSSYFIWFDLGPSAPLAPSPLLFVESSFFRKCNNLWWSLSQSCTPHFPLFWNLLSNDHHPSNKSKQKQSFSFLAALHLFLISILWSTSHDHTPCFPLHTLHCLKLQVFWSERNDALLCFFLICYTLYCLCHSCLEFCFLHNPIPQCFYWLQMVVFKYWFVITC